MKPKSSPTKVVIFSTVHRATDDRIFHKQARSLARAGYEVCLLAAAPHDILLEDVRIRAIAKPSSRIIRVLSSLKLIGRILKEKADIHHFHDPELLPVGLLLRLLGKKVIYDAHEEVPKDILTRSYLPAWLRPMLSGIVDVFERAAARCMSAVVTARDSTRRRLRGELVLGNYPLLEYIRQSQDTPLPAQGSTPFVVYFGTIARILGATEMLAAVNTVSRCLPLRLKLLGAFEDDGLRSEFLHSAESRLVDYGGFVPMRDAYRQYAGALAGLLVYHPCPNALETASNKLFECMACGVPVIASDFPLWRRIVHEQGCGLVVDPLNVPQVADAIIYLLEHPEEAKKMGRRGKELVAKKYNWESESKKLLLLYQELLGKARLGV